MPDPPGFSSRFSGFFSRDFIFGVVPIAALELGRSIEAGWAFILTESPNGLHAFATICRISVRRMRALDLEVDGALVAASTNLSVRALLVPDVPPGGPDEVHSHLSLESFEVIFFNAPDIL